MCIGFGVCLLAMGSSWGQTTGIDYTLTDLGGNRWQYEYEVSNFGLSEGIELFTVYFDYGLAENITIDTPEPPANGWEELILEEIDVIQQGFAYDAESLAGGIAVGQSVSGFRVSFDWCGGETPGAQYYEVYDAGTFELQDSGYTVPEPCGVGLLVLGGLGVIRRKRE